jgi:DMSO/TMAO reductase YedYZ molybdopterin-dependent catalytic subunit
VGRDGVEGTPPYCPSICLTREPATALFVVRHQHDPQRCPATDPYLGANLLNYLSPSQVRQFGVELHGEAIVQGQHTLYLILEASDEDRVMAFMAPFAKAGTVDVYPASTCARVVASGGCALPPTSTADPASVDPEEACQHAIDAGLVVHRAHPLNCETSIPALIGGVVMPNARFYVRNHYGIPTLDPAMWRLQVSGAVDRPLSLTLRELQQMPSQTLVVTLECAGNGRSLLCPPVPGEQWALGAVSTAEWTGVPLVEVLDRAGVARGAVEVLFGGADRGEGDERFERSLPVQDAVDGDVLLAYAMNGDPLPVHHGFPLRAVVPGWYAVASVKWLTRIDVLRAPFAGFYQADRYIYEWSGDEGVIQEPVTLQQVRALITEPGTNDRVNRRDLVVRGVAWSGAAPVARVEVSISGGTWQTARLVGERRRHSWQWWELLTQVDRPGPASIRARATDLAGRSQPDVPAWNRLGYGTNAIQHVSIEVVDP